MQNKPVNTLASIATYATLIAVLQASAPNLKSIFIAGGATREQIFDLFYTISLTVLAIASKSQENPLEYTPKWMVGINKDAAQDNASKLKK